MSYVLKELAANPGNFGKTRTAGSIRYLVFHYTGNDGDRAESNARYFRDWVVEASAHYFVDDAEVYRSVPELATAWAVGGKKYADIGQTGGAALYGICTNANSISIELCGTLGDGSRRPSAQTLHNAAVLGREIMRRYQIPMDRVCRHFDVTGKHCPAYFMDAAAWQDFRTRLKEADMDNIPGDYAKEAVAWARQKGILQGDAKGDLRLHDHVTREQAMVFLYRAQAQM